MPSFSYIPKDLVANYEEWKQEAAVASKDSSAAETATTATPSAAAAANGVVVVAATQLTGSGLVDSDVSGWWDRAIAAVETAAQQGAQVILLPELFLGPYFCQSQEADLQNLADPLEKHVVLQRMQALAKKYKVVLPISFFERSNNCFYNSVVVIDADGSQVGHYRKSHIPDGTGYQEKFYFSPGDTGLRVFETCYCKIGVAICWDQWFPEAARALALQGADVILYPTAIGSEPQDPSLNSREHWQRVMQGHAAANMVPVIASNRFGTEILLHADGTEKQRITFYGHSFITDETGKIVAECADNEESGEAQVVTATVDTEANRKARAAWGLFRDRRPELYKVLLTKDGKL